MSNKLQYITRFFGRTGLKLQAAAPGIMTVAGIGALLAAGVVAIKVTPKMEPVVDELEADLENIESSRTMTPDEKIQHKFRAYTTMTVRAVKVYAPSLALAALGVTGILYSHGLLKRRNAALMAAYGVLERSFSAYRERVRESFSEDVEQMIADGHVIKATDVDPESQTISWEPTNPGQPSGRSEYAVEFGPQNRNWNSASPDYNLVFLRAQEKFANHRLQSRGHVLLNDVYDALGFERTPAGCVVGWVRNGPDGVVDFGLPEAGSPEEQDYFYFYDGEGPIYLDFNVDGVIYDKL